MSKDQHPPGPSEDLPSTRSAEPPRRFPQIGNYRVLQRLGEGGMGEVYEAEQQEPVRRRVALKVIRLGMDSRHVIARFESERQALAVLDHPNVTKVFDAGTTQNGRPYFAMEYVQGVPITKHCDRHRLSVSERLGLFIEVCEGVQHAHQKAIIHRDIKPSNVLVAIQDDRAVPKIIDFGLAKATAQRLTDHTLVTELGQMVGTLEYMSPEQAEMSGQDVDTRTDVYSLGALLYELLTGDLPFGSKELREAGVDEIRRRIREEEAPRPSTRLLGQTKAASRAASNRRSQPSSLARELRGDLDWITMKAIEKDRRRRYSSPSEFAADIQRHLRNEPVQAGPPSTLYRARKFIRRHRIGVSAAIALVLILAGFTVRESIQARRIAEERDRANQQSETTRRVSEFLVDLFYVSDPGEARGNTITARELLDRGRQKIDLLDDEPLVQARLMQTMGDVYRALGLYEESRPLLEESLQITREKKSPGDIAVADAASSLGFLRLEQADYEGARPLFDEALATYEQSGDDTESSVAMVLGGLAALFAEQGEVEEARIRYTRALEINERVYGPDHPETATLLNNLAGLHHRNQEYEQAERLYRRALDIRERSLGADHPDVAQTLNNLALLLAGTGDPQGAKALYERALEIKEKALGPEHRSVLVSIYNLACLSALQGDRKGAIALLRTAVDRGFENLWITRDPDLATLRNEPEFQELVAEMKRKMGETRRDTEFQ